MAYEYDATHKFHPEEPWPWMIYEATLEMSRRLEEKPYRVFEWGSGGSTVWLSN